MISSILSLVFLPFSFEPVMICCGFTLVLALFGMIRRFLVHDFTFR